MCGDGIVDPDEICDDGENSGEYGGCMPGCQHLAARCGDGIVNGEGHDCWYATYENCDDGDPNDGIDCQECRATATSGMVGCNTEWIQATSVTVTSPLGSLTATHGFFGLNLEHGCGVITGAQFKFVDDSADLDMIGAHSQPTPWPEIWVPAWFEVLDTIPHNGKWVSSSISEIYHDNGMDTVMVEATIVIDGIAGSWLAVAPEDPPRLLGHFEGGITGSFEAVYCEHLSSWPTYE